MKTIGLTGGIGSGKSTVSKILLSLKIPVYDSDSRAKYLMNSSLELKNEIIENFGENSYVNNQLDKNYISDIIFNNKFEMNKINLLVHPFVYQDFNKWKKHIFSKYVFFESALIFETGSYKNNDFNILVVSDINERIKRVVKRDCLNKKDVLIRIKNQWNDKKKIPLSDYVIKNISFDQTEKEVCKMIKKLNSKFL
tara:strand:+ start:26967 stop:27554 length:588 start_codon:yes stop_codon:yes gene_type:complete